LIAFCYNLYIEYRFGLNQFLDTKGLIQRMTRTSPKGWNTVKVKVL